LSGLSGTHGRGHASADLSIPLGAPNAVDNRHLRSPSSPGNRFDFVPARANGQPAFGAYLHTPCIRHGTGLYMLTPAGDRICAMARFEGGVLPWFGLPRSLSSR
jgi:hypothetical protein